MIIDKKNNYKISGEALIAYSEGKDIQIYLNPVAGWIDLKDYKSDDWFKLFIRIKPEKKRRLMLVEELPFVFVTRRSENECLSSWNKLELSANFIIIRPGFEWSTDGKAWHSFYVEEE